MNNTGTFPIARLRPLIFTLVTVLHILLLLLVAFNMETGPAEDEPIAGPMRLINVEEEIPPPPEEETPPITQEALAQHVIETDEIPPPIGPAQRDAAPPAPVEQIAYLRLHEITVNPVLPEEQIIRAMVYPPIARRSNIEGVVHLELFIDRYGNVRDVRVLREDPPGRGFGEAAVNAFRGIRGSPAEADGVPVAVRFRYNLTFRLN